MSLEKRIEKLEEFQKEEGDIKFSMFIVLFALLLLLLIPQFVYYIRMLDLIG